MSRASSLLFSAMILSVSYSLVPPDQNVRESSATADYDTYSFNLSPTSSELTWYPKSGKFSSTGRDYSAFIALFQPSYFAFLPPTTDGCTDYVKTSVSSSETWECEYATNGGFFTWSDVDIKCVGNLISDGKTIIQEGMNNANFAITPDGKIVVGFIDDSVVTKLNPSQLMSGSGWLVRNGKSYTASSPDLNVSSTFVTEKAPRTAVGIFENGTMALVEVDGEEDINYGPDLFEFAELLAEIGIHSAINIDGGGSSVSVSEGKVISQPTCDDTSTICEREVQSITCVRKQKVVM